MKNCTWLNARGDDTTTSSSSSSTTIVTATALLGVPFTTMALCNSVSPDPTFRSVNRRRLRVRIRSEPWFDPPTTLMLGFDVTSATASSRRVRICMCSHSDLTLPPSSSTPSRKPNNSHSSKFPRNNLPPLLFLPLCLSNTQAHI